MDRHEKEAGFTFIERMIVPSIIRIVATMAILSFQGRVIRAQVQEARSLSSVWIPPLCGVS